MSKWIDIVEDPTYVGKTRAFGVVNKESKTLIGEIRWYGPWRQYAFLPERDTVYEPTCMDDISAFIKKLMEERRNKKKVYGA